MTMPETLYFLDDSEYIKTPQSVNCGVKTLILLPLSQSG